MMRQKVMFLKSLLQLIKAKMPIFAPYPAATPVGIVSYEVCWTPENFSGWDTSRKPKIIPIKESACDEQL